MLTPSSNDPKRAEALLDREKSPHRWGTPYKTIVKTVIEKSVPATSDGIKEELKLKDKQISSLQGELNQERDSALGLEGRVKAAEGMAPKADLLTWSKKKLAAYSVFRFDTEIDGTLTVKNIVEELLALETKGMK